MVDVFKVDGYPWVWKGDEFTRDDDFVLKVSGYNGVFFNSEKQIVISNLVCKVSYGERNGGVNVHALDEYVEVDLFFKSLSC